MTRTPFHGGSYVDAGRDWYVVEFLESHFQTHLGRVELPPGEKDGLLFVRGSNVGGFHFAGKALNSNFMWEWRDGKWTSFNSVPGRGCYDQQGVYRDALPAGFQYCADDGTLMSRNDTYTITDALSEWTLRDGVRIGQGHNGGGCRVFADGALRELEPGPAFCIFINYNRDGEHATVSWWNSDAREAVIVQATQGEFNTLPKVGTTQPDPGTPDPAPKPEPTPMPYEPQAPDITPLIRARAVASPVEWEEARKRPGHARTDRFVRLLAADAHAFDPRFGLNGKRGGDEVSADALAFKNPTVPAHLGGVEIRDFISSTHEPVWQDVTILPGHPDHPNGVAGKWIQPAVTEPVPDEPKPDEPKPAPTKNKDEIRAAIVELVRFYNEPDGLNRAARGIPPPVTVDDPAFWDWIALAIIVPIDQVKDRIRQFPEYKDQHK